MPAIQANARQFLQNSDYPADQVTYLTSGSYVVPGSSSLNVKTIPHDLPFIPLIGGNFSLVSDFSVSYEYSSGPLTSPINPAAIYDTVATIYADASNVYISTDAVSAGSRTVYYRIYGFAPSTDTSSLAPITNLGDNFVLDTDYNLTKLLLNDAVLLPATTGAGGQVDILHNLGYIPQAQAWILANGYVSPVPSVNPFASFSVFSPGPNMVSFGIGTFNPAEIGWFRVYIDD